MKIKEIRLIPNNARLTCYLQDLSPEMKTADIRPAMLIFPGGGYMFCSDREAEPIALSYLAEGFNAFVLRYAVGEDAPWSKSFEDANAAMACLIKNAEEFRIDPKRIAVCGFSAGGHLAAAVSTAGDIRPAAMVLGYPVTLKEFGPPMGKEILGCDEAVDDKTPPAFIFSTSDDALVPIRNSLIFAEALAARDIIFELHIYPHGEHGCSLAKRSTANGNPGTVNPDAQGWVSDSVRFLTHVFGDFSVGGSTVAGDLPDYRNLSIDTPLKYICKREDACAAVRNILGETFDAIVSNDMAKSISLRAMAGWAPKVLTPEILEGIADALAKLGEKE